MATRGGAGIVCEVARGEVGRDALSGGQTDDSAVGGALEPRNVDFAGVVEELDLEGVPGAAMRPGDILVGDRQAVRQILVGYAAELGARSVNSGETRGWLK